MKTCASCQRQFPIEADDLKFYEKMEVPQPNLCPFCRQQRRLAFRNEINFFHRKCDKTGKTIFSMYPANSPYTIYDQEEWWKDDWDAMKYGRDFDFNRPFFEQFEELRCDVPRMSLNCIANENSYYANYALRNKNCYLVSTADYNEDCYYGRFSDRNFRCMDFDFTYDSKFCFQTLNCHRCNACAFSQKLEGCSENYFCYDMRNCHNCIFSANLRNQSFMIFNKKVSPEEFIEFKAKLRLSSRSGIAESIKKFNEFLIAQPRKYLETIQCEDCVGDYLKNCKNAKFCFDGYELHDVKYCSQVFKLKDSFDWDFVGEKSERCYEMVSSAGNNFFCRFCMNVWQGNSNLLYCDLCLFSSDLFGCVGLRKKKYCILNKQYDKASFDKLRMTLIEHMKKTGEFGEFFPINLSPFAYNDSLAQEYFPLTKEEAQTKGLKWRDPDKKDYQKQTADLTDDIKDIPPSITEETLACPNCGKNFKIMQQELAFYREMKLAAPQQCWICRHKARMSLKNPRIIHQRNCAKCNIAMVTTYTPERPEPIYCEKCYLSTIH